MEASALDWQLWSPQSLSDVSGGTAGARDIAARERGSIPDFSFLENSGRAACCWDDKHSSVLCQILLSSLPASNTAPVTD